jgi:hypothetical protein
MKRGARLSFWYEPEVSYLTDEIQFRVSGRHGPITWRFYIIPRSHPKFREHSKILLEAIAKKSAVDVEMETNDMRDPRQIVTSMSIFGSRPPSDPVPATPDRPNLLSGGAAAASEVTDALV